MNTKVVAFDKRIHNSEFSLIRNLGKMRDCSLNDWLIDPWLSARLSGTVKKNAALNMKVTDQLRGEALAQTLGWTWESVQSSLLNFNDAISEGDCHAITEAGWFADRYIQLKHFAEDHFEMKYIIVDDHAGERKEGVGLICRQTNIQWIQPGSIVFCFLTLWDPFNKEWSEAQNPF